MKKNKKSARIVRSSSTALNYQYILIIEFSKQKNLKLKVVFAYSK